jgi:uncharacterized membrane protein
MAATTTSPDIKTLAIILLIILAIDFIWLTLMKPMYFSHLTAVQFGNPVKFNMIYAGLSYLTMGIVITFLLIPRIQNDNSLKNMFLTGILGGLAMYGVYNFTNASTLQNWGIKPLIIDLTWGCTLTTITLIIFNKFFT